MTEILLIIGATLLFFMAVPRLSSFYSRHMSEASTFNTFLMSVGGFAVALVLWALFGRQLAFDAAVSAAASDSIDWPFVIFQTSFAAVAIVLIFGSIMQRMKFNAGFLFAGFWILLLYSTLTSWVWNPAGWMYELGTTNIAGGLVIHTVTDVLGALIVLILGRRLFRKHTTPKNDILSVIVGACLLVFGWIWFNAANVLEINDSTSLVVGNTILAAAVGALSWFAIDLLKQKKVSASRGSLGAIAGLVAITPAASVVDKTGTTLLSLISACLVYAALTFKDRLIFGRNLHVAAVHGVAGIWGAFGVGFFAVEGGLMYGAGWEQVKIQLISLIAVASFAAAATAAIGLLLRYAVGFKVSERRPAFEINST